MILIIIIDFHIRPYKIVLGIATKFHLLLSCNEFYVAINL